MRKIIFSLCWLFAANAIAQVNVNWKTPVEGNAKSIYFHAFTQTPIVETSSYYYGMNTIDHSVVWSVKKSEKMAAMQAARTASSLTASSDVTEGLDLEQYYEIPFTQFANINSNIIDVSNGKIILGEENNPFKSLISDDIIAELNMLLLKVKDEDGSEKLYGVDIATSNVLWSTKLAEASTAKDILKIASKASGMDQFKIDLFKPSITKSKDIIYNNSDKLSLINSKTGAIVWENDCNPGTFFMSPDQTKIIVVERPSGMAALGVPKPFGKKVMAIDAATGKDLWKEPIKLSETYKTYKFLNSNEVLIAYKDGLNLYNLETGANLWKKDFEAKNLKSMETISEGLELQYGNKLIVIDSKTGKKLWKKPVEFDGIDENADYEPYKKEYKKTRIILAPTEIYIYDKASGKKRWSRGFDAEARVGFDDTNNNILIISRKRIYLFNPDEQEKSPKAIEIKIENPTEIAGFEVKENGYFIYGAKEFLFIKKDGQLVDQKVYPQLKTNRLANAALITSSIASGILSAHGSIMFADGEQAEFGYFVDPATAKAFEESANAQWEFRKSLKANEKQRRAVKTDNTYAYFLKGEKVNDNVVLSMVVVEKKTGKEVKTLEFSNERDTVFELDFNNNKLYFVDKGEFKSVNL